MDTKEITLLEQQNFYDFDAVIERLKIPEYYEPVKRISFLLLPKKFKQKLIARDPQAFKRSDSLVSFVSLGLVGYMLLAVFVFTIGLVLFILGFPVESFLENHDVLVLSLMCFMAFLFVSSMCFCLGFQDGLRDLEKHRTPDSKGQLIYQHCNHILSRYEDEYFSIAHEDSFGSLELNFQKKVDKCEVLFGRFEQHKSKLSPDDPRYADLNEGSKRAFDAWRLMDEAHMAFKERRKSVLAGIRHIKSKLDDLDFTLGSTNLYQDLSANEQECADLLARTDQRYFELATSLSDDFETMKEVFIASRSYLDNVQAIDPLKVSEHNLLAAKIAGDELDKITKNWLPQALAA